MRQLHVQFSRVKSVLPALVGFGPAARHQLSRALLVAALSPLQLGVADVRYARQGRTTRALRHLRVYHPLDQ